MRHIGAVLALIGVAWCQSTQAEEFNIAVSRAGSNLYRVDGQPSLVATRDCDESATSADAVLEMAGVSGKIFFVGQGTTCAVAAVYRKSRLRPGSYQVTLFPEDNGWCRIDGTNYTRYFRSAECGEIRPSEKAFLRIDKPDSGRLQYLGAGNDTLVTELFERVSL